MMAARGFPAPAFLLAAGSVVELVGGLCLILGVGRPYAAAALIAFTIAASLMMLDFWRYSGVERLDPALGLHRQHRHHRRPAPRRDSRSEIRSASASFPATPHSLGTLMRCSGQRFGHRRSVLAKFGPTRRSGPEDMAFAALAKRNEDGIAVAVGVLKQRFGERLSQRASVREQHGHTTTWLTNQPPDAVIFVEKHRGGARDRARLRRSPRADHPLRHRLVARRASERALRRHLGRPFAHEPHPRRPRRGSRLRGRARRHAQAAQRLSPRLRACSSRSIPAPMRASAAWPRRAPPAPTPSATAR